MLPLKVNWRSLKGILTEMKDPDLKEIRQDLSDKLKSYRPDYSGASTGRVIFSGDGVIRVDGLSNAKYGELLDVEGEIKAIVLDLSETDVGAIVLADDDKVSLNDIVKSTGRIVEVPVGVGLFGRVVDPLGKPIDGLGEIKADNFRPIESAAPSIMERGRVNEPLQTGILAIDSMVPIGKGQRELIIGDRQTGKTTIAIDTILNQKGKDVFCIYVSIGQKMSTVSGIVHTLAVNGALEYTCVVCSTARDSAPLQYIAPFCGCAVAEEMARKGKDVLIVYDDLSKHAVAYRTMSLLLKRAPGREAYPGDVFYLHSRLLERAAKFSDANSGGSITALPIVETQAGDISAYIPTNVISITDGQIYLESELFNAGVRPAVNVGLSVSRVGGSAQLAAMRTVSGKLRLYLSQYRELSVFSQFGSELDPSTAAMLQQGARLTEVLKQGVNCPYDSEHEIILLYVAMKKLLKEVPVPKITGFIKDFTAYLDVSCSDIISEINSSANLSMETGLRIEQAVKEFAAAYMKDEMP